MHYGLIGFPLSHSFSGVYFKEKFESLGLDDHTYQLFPIPELRKELFIQLIIQNRLNGFNVTIPHKQKIIPFLDELSEEAKAIGAVNCVKVLRKGEQILLKGFNTDWIGFSKALRPFLNLNHHHALILGTGGAALAIAYSLNKLGIEFYFVSRIKAAQPNYFTYHDLNENIINHFKLIINTTPLGTMPNENEFANIPFQFMGSNHLAFDLVYNPAKTKFLTKAEQQGAAIMNGLSMLKFQADEALKIWQNK